MPRNDEVLFIAEISANHLGSLSRAHDLIDAAAAAGAGAAKFQTYTPDTMTLNLPTLSVDEDHQLWGGRTLYSLYQEAMTPWEWHEELFNHCRERRLIPFSSPFDETAVDFLESLDVPMYKIASLETSDHALIRRVSATGKPTIISTGATHLDEIEELVSVFRSTGNQSLTLLVCTSSYPANPKDAHVRRMNLLRSKFNVNVGISDHTLGIGVSLAAVSLGATAVEKHLTLRRSDGGADSQFSMEPEEFAMLVAEGNAARNSLGNEQWSIQGSEMESRRLRRSLYVVEDVKAGEKVTKQNIRAIRPGYGLAPKNMEQILEMTFVKDVKKGTPMSWEFVEVRP